MRVLLIEDEKRMASFIARGLKEEHCAVDLAYDAEQGIYLAENNPYDLIILDVILPYESGIFVCENLRDKGIRTPILLLTAKNSVKDKVRGLDAGADDYLTKPFAFEELMARVRALTRKNSATKQNVLQVADLELNRATHKVVRGGQEVVLANKEYALLEYLMFNAGHVMTRAMISEHVWDESFDTLTNVFDVYIHRLRGKIDKDFPKPLIHSVRGVGYVLKEDA
jgi:DNA-binding response OmpR family regulator